VQASNDTGNSTVLEDGVDDLLRDVARQEFDALAVCLRNSSNAGSRGA
jgi:hypothetical protein